MDQQTNDLIKNEIEKLSAQISLIYRNYRKKKWTWRTEKISYTL